MREPHICSCDVDCSPTPFADQCQFEAFAMEVAKLLDDYKVGYYDYAAPDERGLIELGAKALALLGQPLPPGLGEAIAERAADQG